MKYRRSRAKGGTFFFTVVTDKRKKLLCVKENVKIIKDAFKYVSSQHPFMSDAFVMLPDHIHTVWTLPEGDNDFSTRWRLIKRYFNKKGNHENSAWQKRFWEHTIRNDKDFVNHVDYIHYNPVKHGYVKSPKDWEHTTFHRYVSW